MDWEKKQLRDVCEIGDGNYSSKYPKANDFIASGIPFITAKNLKYGTVVSKHIRYISEDQHSTLTKGHVKEGDLVIVVRGSSTGNCSLVPHEYKNSNLNSQLAYLRTENNILDSKFLYYIFSSPCIQKVVYETISGSAQPQLPNNKLLGIEISFPPLNEQKRIVAKLDKCFEAIDKARANVEKNLQNAKDLFQSQLNQIFSQKGEGWVEKNLGSVCENFDSKRIPITKSKRVHGEIPYYGASGIVDYISEFIFDEDLLLVSEDGANLLARTYPIAFSVSGKIWVNNHAHVLKFEDINEQYFIEYFLNSIKLNDYVSGMAQPKLNQKKLNSILVPYPSVEVQRDTVDYLNKLYSQVQSLESNYKQELDALDELKKSILQKAFNGEL